MSDDLRVKVDQVATLAKGAPTTWSGANSGRAFYDAAIHLDWGAVADALRTEKSVQDAVNRWFRGLGPEALVVLRREDLVSLMDALTAPPPSAAGASAPADPWYDKAREMLPPPPGPGLGALVDMCDCGHDRDSHAGGDDSDCVECSCCRFVAALPPTEATPR